MKPRYKIYCDMDGVLVDFETGFQNFAGEHINNIRAESDCLPYRMIAKAGKEFWSDLPWMPDGKILWDFILPHDPTILTAIVNTGSEYAIKGKMDWVERELGDVKFIPTKSKMKQMYAEQSAILIDDRFDIIGRWNDAGGIGIQHKSAKDTIRQLKLLFDIQLVNINMSTKEYTEKIESTTTVNDLTTAIVEISRDPAISKEDADNLISLIQSKLRYFPL